MSRCLNRAELIGYLGAEPELRMLQSGQARATFSVATTWRQQDANDAAQEVTEWSRCVVFGPLAEWCGAALKKGHRVYVSGRLRTRAWEDASAVRRWRTEIVVQELVDFDVEPPSPRRLRTTPTEDRPLPTGRAPPVSGSRR